MTEQLNRTWSTIVQDRNHHIVIKVVDNKIVSSCVCVIIPNLTRNVRPYVIIENVVTHRFEKGINVPQSHELIPQKPPCRFSQHPVLCQ